MKKTNHDCDVQTCMMCRLCMKEWIPAIAANRKNFQIKKGELLFKEGDQVTGIFFLYSGTVKVHKRWENEKELIVRFAKKGDIVGHRGLGKDLVFPVSATALEPVTVCFVAIDFFLNSLKVNQDLLFELMMFYAAELKDSEQNMRDLAHMPVKGRIAKALLTLQEKFNVNSKGEIDFTMTRQDLASLAGTTYETVFRILSEFAQQNVIKLSNKNILLVDKVKLIEYTHDGNT